MYCRKCGKEISNPSSKFCPGCGSPITSGQPEVNGTQHVPSEEPIPQQPKTAKRGRGVVLAAAVVVVVLVICLVSGVVILKNRNAKNASDQLAAATAEPTKTQEAEKNMQTETAADTADVESTQTETPTKTPDAIKTPQPTAKATEQTVTEAATEATTEPKSTPVVYTVQQLTGMTASATSQLADYGTKSYGAANLFDGNLSTAYVEGVDGVGAGEQITIDLDQTSRIDYIIWYPGYQISEELLAKYGYPTVLTFYFSDGTSVTSQVAGALAVGMSVTVDVPDGVSASWIRVEITNAAAGSTYEDTCISEMELYGWEE